MELLRKLRDALSVTLRAYSRFSKSDGDKRYFSDVTNCSAFQNSIFESFENLADLLLRINSLDDSCKYFRTHVRGRRELRMIVLTKRSAGPNYSS